jgi:hypothetical protein
MQRNYSKLLGAALTASLMLATIAGVAVAGPDEEYSNAVAADQRHDYAAAVPRDNQGETAATIRMRMRRGWTDGAKGVAQAKFVQPRRRTFPHGVSAVWRS